MAAQGERDALLRAIASKAAIVRRLSADVSSYTRELRTYNPAPAAPPGADAEEHRLRMRQAAQAAEETRVVRERCIVQLRTALGGLEADVCRADDAEATSSARAAIELAAAALEACENHSA